MRSAFFRPAPFAILTASIRKGRSQLKRGIIALMVIGTLLSLSIRAGASEMKGSVEVKLDTGELPVTNGAVTLYRVGVPTDGGYRLLDRYGGGVVRSEDISSGNLARWLSELADSGREQLLDVEGRVVFSQVEEGLYLVRQTQRMDGFWPFRVFLAEVPAGQQVLRYEPVVQPITEEPPCTGDLTIYLSVLGMALSGGGLMCCGIWDRKKRG